MAEDQTMEDMLDVNAPAPGSSTPCETDDDVMLDLNAPMTEVSVGDNLNFSPEASVDVGGSGYKSPSVPIEDDSTASVTVTLINFQEGTSMGQPVSAMNPNDTSLKFASYMLLSQQASASVPTFGSRYVWEFPVGGSHGVPNVDERSSTLKWVDPLRS
ncbi:hypothetical protein AKJ16_DCAP08547 [Drosera capensis]